MEPSLILGLILGVVSALVALPFLIRLWPKQGQWGINTKPVGCPECGEAFPRIRKPANKRNLFHQIEGTIQSGTMPVSAMKPDTSRPAKKP